MDLKSKKADSTAGNARQAQIREGMADFDAAVIKPYRLVRVASCSAIHDLPVIFWMLTRVQDDLLRTVNRLIDSREDHGTATGSGDKGSAPEVKPVSPKLKRASSV